jgi:putative ABC transport system permease protein
LGFRRGTILGLFVGEGVALAVVGGLVGWLATRPLLLAMAQSPQGGGLFTLMGRQWLPALPVALGVSLVVGLVSSLIPSYNTSRTGIVEGLRHIG